MAKPTMAISTTKPMACRSPSGFGPPIKNCAANIGPRKGKGEPSAVLTVKPMAIAKAMRRPWRFARSSPGFSSTDIGQRRDQADPEMTNGVHDRVISRVDYDIDLRAVADALRQRSGEDQA